MRPPDSISALCAMTFGLLGAAFVVIGTLYGCLDVSIRGAASSWAFLPIGLACLLLCLVCALAVRRRRRREGRLPVCRGCRAGHHRSGAPPHFHPLGAGELLQLARPKLPLERPVYL